jgi:ubiquinone/menaquinone biosynthesis C-methylase UbiE
LETRLFARLRGELFARLPHDATILELGAGTGLNFRFYPCLKLGVATEPSIEMLRLAGVKERPTELRLVQSCAEVLPFPDNTFDVALATLVFCSVDSPQQAFAEIRRVVKPGGVVFLLEHVRPKGLLGAVFDVLNLLTEPLFGDRFNRRTATLAQTSGLELQGVEDHWLGVINLITCRVR